ncbi:hypothetical protein [Flavilitoribacter nigricans]|uniref:Uncharacterized protein n=1 Tax=Flavilitoribacter nigricans (strain ATCC 23147 / DSM 23189 / NBRC 102662 / NCIMB 1420 / SS-2) TaxID=1122177 RepID=A0A2D0N700_FLAN2|nr:hypothetical protein [Flavilitoribacter nigricans]PHN04156.1 hypothetical protein CRP01_23455 [Flavilitoribacter nigricans DSM 23189 = NBRC 102662]
MDQLEKKIRENQAELDRIESVDADALWQKIQQPEARIRPLPARSGSGWQLQVGRNWQLTAAAAVLLLIGVSIWLIQPPGQESMAGANLSVEDYYPEIADEEMAFRRTIARKEAELNLDGLNRQEFIDIFNELDELEKIHRRQMQDLPEVFDNDEWVSTLMRYYEQKLRILERLSREIDKQKQVEERSRARSI